MLNFLLTENQTVDADKLIEALVYAYPGLSWTIQRDTNDQCPYECLIINPDSEQPEELKGLLKPSLADLNAALAKKAQNAN